MQVAECQNKDPHDWTLCVFAHGGEKARRRDPAVYRYVATACPDFRKVGRTAILCMQRRGVEQLSKCLAEALCASSALALLVYLCNMGCLRLKGLLQGTCKRGDVCPFAHGVFESWLHPGK